MHALGGASAYQITNRTDPNVRSSIQTWETHGAHCYDRGRSARMIGLGIRGQQTELQQHHACRWRDSRSPRWFQEPQARGRTRKLSTLIDPAPPRRSAATILHRRPTQQSHRFSGREWTLLVATRVQYYMCCLIFYLNFLTILNKVIIFLRSTEEISSEK